MLEFHGEEFPLRDGLVSIYFFLDVVLKTVGFTILFLFVNPLFLRK